MQRLLRHVPGATRLQTAARSHAEASKDLDGTTDAFLSECDRPRQPDSSAPGDNPHLRKHFAPIMGRYNDGSGKDPTRALGKARLVLKTTIDALQHQIYFLKRSMRMHAAWKTDKELTQHRSEGGGHYRKRHGCHRMNSRKASTRKG